MYAPLLISLALVLSILTWGTILYAIRLGFRGLDRRTSGIAVAMFLIVLLATSIAGFATGGVQVSDAVEYLAIARRAVFDGRVDLQMAGQNFPSRFQPWFSLTFLLPFQLLAPNSIVVGIPIAIAGALAVLGAGLLAARYVALNQKSSAILVAGALAFFLPLLRYLSSALMTDVPAACLVVAGFLLVDEKSRRGRFAQFWLLFVVTLLRPLVGVVALAGFLTRNLSRSFLFPLSGVAGAIFCISILNYWEFGSVYQSGYHFWMPIPYEFLGNVFNLDHVFSNLREVQSDSGMFLVAAAWIATVVLWPKIAVGARRLARGFFALSFLLIGFHLFYFYPSVRFQLPAQVLAASVIAVVVLNLPWTRKGIEILKCVSAVLVFAAAASTIVSSTGETITNEVERFAKVSECIPEDAIFITAANVLLAEEFVGRSPQRKILPFSREQEYASKVVFTGKHTLPAVVPLHAWKNSDEIRALLPDARDVYAETGQGLQSVQILLEQGKQIFFDVQTAADPTANFLGHPVKIRTCPGIFIGQVLPLP